MTDYNVEDLLQSMADKIQQMQSAGIIKDPLMIGIHTGGVWIAERLHEMLNLKSELSSLNILFYRDDFTRIGVHPQVKPSNITEDVEDQHIILVDDVLYTGRTIRAALNEIFDYGRPKNIFLAVLVDRDGRELPIQPDIAGLHLDLNHNEQIKLSGPSPLKLSIKAIGENA